MILTVSITVLAVITASYNLSALYRHEKAQAMATVAKCAENAFLLEMIGRMKSSEDVPQSFVRLNTIIESAQQKDAIPAGTDTLRTSLASILRFGLEFQNNRWQPDPQVLDSIFLAEIHRNGLDAEEAFIRSADEPPPPESGKLWKTDYRISPAASTKYDVYVSPMYKDVLARMWGIIIPFLILISAFSFLSVYLTGFIRRLRTLEKMKDDFTHNMTHELKTPVAVAYSAADSMLRYYDQSDGARNRRFLRIILQRLGHLSGMIENILSMSMERFETMKLDIETVTVGPLAAEVADMMRLKAGKPVRIDIDIPDSLRVKADPSHLGNVLANLIDNAIKYSGDSVDIAIKVDSGSMTVTDNGIGIDRNDLPYIFDKFYRVTSGDRYETGGYGLGLFYVKQIIGLLGWSIEAESKPGKGTRFTIKFR